MINLRFLKGNIAKNFIRSHGRKEVFFAVGELIKSKNPILLLKCTVADLRGGWVQTLSFDLC